MEKNSMISNKYIYYRRIHFRMSLNYYEFNEKMRESFLNDFGQLVGCTNEDYRGVYFREGCVRAEVVVTNAAAVRWELYYSNRYVTKNTEEGAKTGALVEQYHITASYVGIVECTELIKDPVRSKKCIVLVHGLIGDEKSFGDLPSYLEDKTKCEVRLFFYRTSLHEKSSSLVHVSRKLENWIHDYLQGVELAIFAHSMGGVVVRHCIVSQHGNVTPLDKWIKQLSLIASPNAGASKAKYLLAVPVVTKDQLRDIEPNSGFLNDLNARWIKWVRSDVGKECNVRCVYATDDGIVDQVSACILDGEPVPIDGATHTSIVKPQSKGDEIVVKLVRFLKEAHFIN